MMIGGKRLDDPSHVWIIAEASGNHNQEYDKAELLVRFAAAAGADAVKFQLFAAETICVDIPLPFGHSPEQDAWFRQLGVTRMRELFAKGGLPREWCVPLKKLAEECGIAWLCTPFSVEEARFLVEEVGVEGLKIASGDITFFALLEYAASTGLPTIMSTGGATIDEIEMASQYWNGSPNHPVLLHCRSVYPCDEEIVNLRAIETLRAAFFCPVGFSDHTLSIEAVPALAVSLGATVYEKHMRLAGDTNSVDAAHSLDPGEFRRMVEVIRKTPVILGDGKKEPHPLEMHDRLWARRGEDGLRPTNEARQGRWE